MDLTTIALAVAMIALVIAVVACIVARNAIHQQLRQVDVLETVINQLAATTGRTVACTTVIQGLLDVTDSDKRGEIITTVKHLLGKGTGMTGLSGELQKAYNNSFSRALQIFIETSERQTPQGG